MVRDVEHVTVYRDPAGEWNAAFPELTRLADGDLLVSFREARYGPPETGAGHNHSEPRCRGSLIRSTDGGQTWPLDGCQQLTGTFPMEQCSVSAASDDLVLFIYALNVLQTRPLDGHGARRLRVARRADLHRPGAPLPGRRPDLGPGHAADPVSAQPRGDSRADDRARRRHPAGSPVRQPGLRSGGAAAASAVRGALPRPRVDLGRRLDRGPRPERPAALSPGLAGAAAGWRDPGADAQRTDHRPARRPRSARGERLADPFPRCGAHLERAWSRCRFA